MCKRMGKKFFKLLLASTCIALLGGETAFAKPSKADQLVKEEDGFYYGYGNAATKEEAEFNAKKNLIETALTTTAKEVNPKASRITISDEAVGKRLTNIKPFVQNKPGTNVTYRIKLADWEKDEKIFREKIRTELSPSYSKLTSSTNISEKITTAIYILDELTANGEKDFLTLHESETELISKKVEAVCASIINNLQINLSVKDGFVNNETKYVVSVKDEKSKAVAGLELKATWSPAESAISLKDKEVEDVVSIIKTDKDGKAVIDYPLSEDYKNTCVVLTVSTLLSNAKYPYAALKKLDSKSSVDGCFVHYDDFESVFKGVGVAGGEFAAGKVPGDTKAGSKEATHTVTLTNYEIDITPVTNAQFAAFVFATRADELPEYFENPDYNGANQPVVGVTYAAAEAYAQWLSEQTGRNYRLPTAEEWEKAARAGTENVYPWGNEDPSKGKKANYKGNGKFKFPSPVGSFPDSTNPWGLVDMSGNVWEWTSSVQNVDEGNDERNVKGGSWMDGPVELRISNYKNSEAASGHPDVGFRLVRDVEEVINNETEEE